MNLGDGLKRSLSQTLDMRFDEAGQRLYELLHSLDQWVFDEGYDQEGFDDLDMRAYVADFETTTVPDDCRVWAWATSEVGDDANVEYGNLIDTFVGWCSTHAPCQLYFHNLGFDGTFLMDWLERNGWSWVPDKDRVTDRSFTTLISDMSSIYEIMLYFTPVFKVRIWDSLKIIPLSVASMARSYGLEMLKGDLDHEAYREPGHELTGEELVYIEHDVRIVAKVLELFKQQGLTRMTAGSNALSDYRRSIGGRKGFDKVYPQLKEEEDAFIRKAYRGGFTYVAPRFANKRLGAGIVLDVNSLYPSVMHDRPLPTGRPQWFDGDPHSRGDGRVEDRPLWVALVTCRFRLKVDHIPCIQLKNNGRFKPTEYLEDSDGEVTFATTSVDWDLITHQYDVSRVRWFGGYDFKASEWQFREYVDRWTEVKVRATREGNMGLRAIAKIMLNSLYGKFAAKIRGVSRYPALDDDGVLRYHDLPEEARRGVYLPVAVFVTAWARYKTITSAQSVYERFVYADTDSLHLIGTDVPGGLDVDPVRLGAWKHESTFDEAKFIRAKTYVEHEVGADRLTVHVAGMPSRCHRHVTLDNFDLGASYDGKLYQRRVPGGIVLVEGPMEIRG